MLADVEGSGRAAVSEGAGHPAPGGDVGTAEELRGQVRRSVLLPEEVRGEEQRGGGGKDAAAGGATQQQVKTACSYWRKYLKGKFRILQLGPYFLIILCQTD